MKLFTFLGIGICMLVIIGCERTVLFTNTHIYNHQEVDAILVKDGKIQSIGLSTELKGAQTIDLKGGYLYPGFTDAHMHLVGYGWSKEKLDLVGTESPEQILNIIHKAASELPEGTWIQGRGWDQNDWAIKQFPTKEMLDKVVPNHPVILRRIDGHAVWTNSQVLEVSDITAETPDPDGGKIIRDEEGNPTGVFVDRAIRLVSSFIPKTSKADKQRQILTAQKYLNAVGLTSIHDAGTDLETTEILEKLSSKGELTIRIYAMLNDNPDDYSTFLKSGPKIDNPFYKIRSVKLYMDGALGSRGAALIEPYADEPENRGLVLTDSMEVARLVTLFNAKGFQVSVHCIGDRANRMMLDIFEKVGTPDQRNRIEHAQIIHPDDIPRFATLDVLPSMQATHCTSDMYWADERLGPARLQGAYPWQSLIKAGSVIPGGSDAPVELPDPLHGIYAALTRQDANGWPEGGWIPEERLTLDQAIKMVSEWPAFASFEENVKGKIEPGYYADFTVLNRPLDEVNTQNILKTKINFTIVGGKVVFSR